MTSEKLAIDGGAPVRTRPFESMWVFGGEERKHLMEVMDRAPNEWRKRFKVNEFANAFAERHGIEYAIPTDSGNGAVHTAVAAINPNPGDEVSHDAGQRRGHGTGHPGPERNSHIRGHGP